MDELQEMINRLPTIAIDAFDMRSSGSRARLLYVMAQEAMSGDPGFARLVARKVAATVIAGKELDAIERYWLVHVLIGMVLHDDKAAAIARVAGSKGAPKRGRKGLQSAFAVLGAVTEGAKSLEAAWEAVARKHHRDAKTVKADWIKWRKVVVASLADNDGDGEEALRDLLANNRQA